jgi:O-antigen ligase
MQKSAVNYRLVVVCLAAASVGLPMTIISVAKLLLLLFALGALLRLARQPGPGMDLTALATPAAILLALAGMAVSIIWSDVPLHEATEAWGKHAKLLVIPLLLWLIRSERDARLALLSFIAAQIFLLLSSWLLRLGVPLPWATSNLALTAYAVFSSYLDQAIMSSVTAALCWHLRHLAPARWGRPVALAVVLLAIGNVFFVLTGRTGHLVLIALVSLAIMWALPRSYRLLAAAVPFGVLAAVLLVSPQVLDRMTVAVQELQSYAETGQTKFSSMGERLNYWQRSMDAIAEHPIAGSGVGSWNQQYRRLDQGRGPVNARFVRNPHQEFLLWGVEAGVLGMALLLNFLVAVWRDAWRMDAATARATQSVLAALVIACLFNSSLFDATIGDFFCVSLGLMLALGWQTRIHTTRAPTGKEATA